MKYDSLRKTNRNLMILRYRKEHPELSQQEIAAIFNISRQRVSKILKSSPPQETANG